MPRFAANPSMLFTEARLLDRFERAARAGLSTVEMQFPYDTPAAASARGIACDPAGEAEFTVPVRP